jgi:hypothetical protein
LGVGVQGKFVPNSVDSLEVDSDQNDISQTVFLEDGWAELKISRKVCRPFSEGFGDEERLVSILITFAGIKLRILSSQYKYDMSWI